MKLSVTHVLFTSQGFASLKVDGSLPFLSHKGGIEGGENELGAPACCLPPQGWVGSVASPHLWWVLSLPPNQTGSESSPLSHREAELETGLTPGLLAPKLGAFVHTHCLRSSAARPARAVTTGCASAHGASSALHQEGGRAQGLFSPAVSKVPMALDKLVLLPIGAWTRALQGALLLGPPGSAASIPMCAWGHSSASRKSRSSHHSLCWSPQNHESIRADEKPGTEVCATVTP